MKKEMIDKLKDPLSELDRMKKMIKPLDPNHWFHLIMRMPSGSIKREYLPEDDYKMRLIHDLAEDIRLMELKEEDF